VGLTDRVLAHTIFDIPLDGQDKLDSEEYAKHDDRGINKEL
jgi:hypothetical protein